MTFFEVTNTTFSGYSDDVSDEYSEVIRVWPKSCITVVLLSDEESDVYEVPKVTLSSVVQVILSFFLLIDSSFSIISYSEQLSSSSSINILILGYISTRLSINYW